MKNRILPIAAVALCLSLPSVCQARIGETLEQCIQRYGKPVGDRNDRRAMFAKGDFYLIAYFFKGRVDMIAFAKKDNLSPISVGLPISENEINILLQDNCCGKQWMRIASKPTALGNWSTSDGELLAVYYGPLAGWLKNNLAIATAKAFYRNQASEAKKLRGF